MARTDAERRTWRAPDGTIYTIARLLDVERDVMPKGGPRKYFVLEGPRGERFEASLPWRTDLDTSSLTPADMAALWAQRPS